MAQLMTPACLEHQAKAEINLARGRLSEEHSFDAADGAHSTDAGDVGMLPDAETLFQAEIEIEEGRPRKDIVARIAEPADVGQAVGYAEQLILEEIPILVGKGSGRVSTYRRKRRSRARGFVDSLRPLIGSFRPFRTGWGLHRVYRVKHQ